MQEKIFQELEQVRLSAGGFLRPEDVVAFAEDETTELHSKFTWDDSEAAAKYRLAEARAIIRVAVVVNAQTGDNIRAFVSLTPERNSEGGYRAIAEVLDDEALTGILLRDALAEVASFKRKLERYKELTALNRLVDAVDQTLRRYGSEDEDRASA